MREKCTGSWRRGRSIYTPRGHKKSTNCWILREREKKIDDTLKFLHTKINPLNFANSIYLQLKIENKMHKISTFYWLLSKGCLAGLQNENFSSHAKFSTFLLLHRERKPSEKLILAFFYEHRQSRWFGFKKHTINSKNIEKLFLLSAMSSVSVARRRGEEK